MKTLDATTPSEVLDQAREVLKGTHNIPPPLAPRAAAILARQALEDVVDGLSGEIGVDPKAVTRRSQLIILRVLAGMDVADLAAIAWHGLSHACHHHAYELTPTVGETRHLIDQVATLIKFTHGQLLEHASEGLQ